MILKSTEHSYYCNASNYYVNGNNNFGRSDYESWEEFKANWLNKDGTIDDDYNHCFRFDICEEEDGYGLWLFIILQRKGNFIPVHIKSIKEENMPEIKAFLQSRWEYLKGQWVEFSGN